VVFNNNTQKGIWPDDLSEKKYPLTVLNNEEFVVPVQQGNAHIMIP